MDEVVLVTEAAVALPVLGAVGAAKRAVAAAALPLPLPLPFSLPISVRSPCL